MYDLKDYFTSTQIPNIKNKNICIKCDPQSFEKAQQILFKFNFRWTVSGMDGKEIYPFNNLSKECIKTGNVYLFIPVPPDRILSYSDESYTKKKNPDDDFIPFNFKDEEIYYKILKGVLRVRRANSGEWIKIGGANSGFYYTRLKEPTPTYLRYSSVRHSKYKYMECHSIEGADFSKTLGPVSKDELLTMFTRIFEDRDYYNTHVVSKNGNLIFISKNDVLCFSYNSHDDTFYATTTIKGKDIPIPFYQNGKWVKKYKQAKI